jgi:hypothetical protein
MPRASLAYTTDLQEAVDDMVGDDAVTRPSSGVAYPISEHRWHPGLIREPRLRCGCRAPPSYPTRTGGHIMPSLAFSRKLSRLGGLRRYSMQRTIAEGQLRPRPQISWTAVHDANRRMSLPSRKL